MPGPWCVWCGSAGGSNNSGSGNDLNSVFASDAGVASSGSDATGGPIPPDEVIQWSEVTYAYQEQFGGKGRSKPASAGLVITGDINGESILYMESGFKGVRPGVNHADPRP